MGARRIWDDFLTERDQKVLAAAGYGQRSGFGSRPALVVIDVQYNAAGEEPEDILEGIKKYRTHCGREAWESIRHIERLLSAARGASIPIFYTEAVKRHDQIDAAFQRAKNRRSDEKTNIEGTHATQTVAEVAARPGEFILEKRKPSAFFGTILMSYLSQFNVDTLILTGQTTSGCLRATAIDAFAFNLRVVVPEEAAFDRFQASHAMNLFDLNTKYADVIPASEVTDYLASLGRNTA